MSKKEDSPELKSIWNDLYTKAYNLNYHNYHYKEANQVIQEHFERMEQRVQELEEKNAACLKALQKPLWMRLINQTFG